MPEPTCAVDSCVRQRHTKIYCQVHYNRVKRYGRVDRVRQSASPDGLCSIEGCERPYAAKGYCGTHPLLLETSAYVNSSKPVGEEWEAVFIDRDPYAYEAYTVKWSLRCAIVG